MITCTFFSRPFLTYRKIRFRRNVVCRHEHRVSRVGERERRVEKETPAERCKLAYDLLSMFLGSTQWTCLRLCQWIFTYTIIIELNQRPHHDDSCWWRLIIIQPNIITDKLRKEPLISWMHCYAMEKMCALRVYATEYAARMRRCTSSQLVRGWKASRAPKTERETQTQRAVYLLCVGGGLYRIMYLFSFRLIFLIQSKKE